MPRKTIDYKNTIIYKIVCNDLTINNCYVGHTTSFKDRKREHKSRCVNHNSFHIYEFINNNGGWDNWVMVEIEKFECNDVNEATARERYWYELLNSTLNSKCPTLDIETKKEKSKIYLKQYQIDNKEQIKIQRKEFRTQNKERLSISKKEYVLKNKDKLSEYAKELITCSCGCIITRNKMNRHQQTNKHLTLIKE